MKVKNLIMIWSYEPTLYRITAKNLKDLQTIKEELQGMGLTVIDDNFAAEIISFYENNNNQIILIVSLVLYAILTIVYGVIMYLRRDKMRQTERFLQSMGYTRKESEKIIGKVYIYDWLFSYMIIVVLGMTYLLGFGSYIDYPIPISPWFIFIAFPLSMLTIYIVPYFSSHMRRK